MAKPRKLRKWLTGLFYGICALLTVANGAGAAPLGQVTVAWDSNPEPTVTGYRLHYGAASGIYNDTLDAGDSTWATVTGLSQGVTYYFAVTAYDSESESDFSIEISYQVPGNTAPSFVQGANLAVAQGSEPQTFAAWATAISPGPAADAAQAVHFLVANNEDNLFTTPPALDAAGTLTFTAAHNARGTAMVVVQLQDDGDTVNGGQDTSAPVTFSLTLGLAVDADGDGLPDDYALANGINPNQAADAAWDSDGDGYTNGQELPLGTEPVNATSWPAIASIERVGNAIGISFETHAGKSYRIERNDSFPSGPWLVMGSAIAGDGRRLQVVDTSSASLASAVYRVVME